MTPDTPYIHQPARGMIWALLAATLGHAGFVACLFFAGDILSPFASEKPQIVITLPHGMSLDVRPDSTGNTKPKGEDRVYNVANAVAPTPAPRPAPTPAPTPAATPAEEKKIVVPDKETAATPPPTAEPKKATVNKVIKATPPPETPKAPPKAATKTPPVTQKQVAPGTGTGRTAGDAPPALPNTAPTGPAAKGDPNGGTTFGDPNAPINTNVVLPADYLADLLGGLRSNFTVPSNQQGICVVEFKIARDGTLKDIKVVTSSGSTTLDDLALRAVRATARVRSYAAYTQVAEITARVPFHFGNDAPAAPSLPEPN